MKTASWTLAILVVVALTAGCISGEDSDQAGADIQLSSIGQDPVNGDEGVKVIGVAKNYGDAEKNTTATIQLLNGSEVVRERRIDLGTLGPDESVEFSTTFDVSPSNVDGRSIRFD